MITAADILRASEQRDRSAQMAQLDMMLAPEREAVLAVVRRLPPTSRVSLDKIIWEVRQKTEMELAQQQPDPVGAFRHWLRFAPLDDLHALKRKLEAAKSAGKGEDDARAIVSSFLGGFDATTSEAPFTPYRRTQPPADLELDEELDGEPAPRPRVRLRRQRRARMAGKDASSTTAPASTRTAISATARRAATVARLLATGDGTRPRGCPTDADFAKWRNPGPAPWEDDEGDSDED